MDEQIYEEIAISLTKKYNRYFTKEEVKQKFWIMSDGRKVSAFSLSV